MSEPTREDLWPPSSRMALHAIKLTELAIGNRGQTDCSTPLHIRVQNVVEEADKAHAQVAALTAALAEAQRERVEEIARHEARRIELVSLGEELEKQWYRAEAAQAEATALREALEKAHGLLRRLHDWDVMDGTADGAYWRGQIVATVAPVRAVTSDDIAWANSLLGGQPPTGGQTNA